MFSLVRYGYSNNPARGCQVAESADQKTSRRDKHTRRHRSAAFTTSTWKTATVCPAEPKNYMPAAALGATLIGFEAEPTGAAVLAGGATGAALGAVFAAVFLPPAAAFGSGWGTAVVGAG